MNRQERMRIMQLIRLLELFKGNNPKMPLQQAIALLHVAYRPGMTITEMAHMTQTHLATASRHAKAWGEHGPEHQALLASGYGQDGRKKALFLTSEGRKLIDSLLAALLRISEDAPESETISLRGGFG